MGATKCKECSSGSSSEAGSTKCQPVPPGSYSWNGKVRQCERGFFCTGLDSNQSACEAGRYSSVPGSISCIPCAPGTFASSLGSLECEHCPNGYLQDQPKKSFCDKVKDGEVVAKGGSASIQVPLGSKICDDSSSCMDEKAPFEACMAGTYGSDPPTKQCYDCEAGKSSSKGATECQAWYVIVIIFFISFFFFFLFIKLTPLLS